MNRFAILALTVSLAACNQPDPIQEKLALGERITGLASPIKLAYGTTHIHLLDYFEGAEQIDSIAFSSKMDYEFDRDSAIVHVNSTAGLLPLMEMNVHSGAKTYTIPVFNTNQLAHTFRYKPASPQAKQIEVKGNFNGWNAKANPLTQDGETWTTNLVLNPGLYEYKIVEDGKEILDPNNSETKDNGNGGLNSVFRVGTITAAPRIATFAVAGDSLIFHYPEGLQKPLILLQNQKIAEDNYRRNGDRLALYLPNFDFSQERTFLRVYGSDESMRSNDILIPLAKGEVVLQAADLDRTAHHTWSMYFMMVDRFLNGDTAIDKPVSDPEIKPVANYYGGDIRGVVQKLNEGYFDAIGVNTIWLSPITQNPLGAYGLWDKGGVKSKFSGYHGYWPISSSQVDTRFGDSLALADLLSAAHGKANNVLLDYVANHVHQEHPVYIQHPEWATQLYLPDGTLNTERWDEYRLTTWFDTFMPTLDLENDEVVAAMTDSALFWFRNFEIDGFRHDATKHIPLKFWRELTRKLKYEVVVPQNRAVFQIGETYGNPDLIGSYIGSGLLDAQFDFNLYDAAVAAFSRDNGDMANLTRVLNQSLEGYGYHHLMGNISGNQDRTRFISFADGSVSPSEDVKLAGWTRRIEIKDTIGYDRLLLLHAFNFTVPGIPVIYYGDEIGMPGANDPDNRRMMRFGDDLAEAEKSTLTVVSKLAKLRANNMALLYGDLEVLAQSEDYLIFVRNYFDRVTVVCLHSGREAQEIQFKIPAHLSASKLQSTFGTNSSAEGQNITVTLQPVSFEILTN